MTNGSFYPLTVTQGVTLDIPFSIDDDNTEFSFDDYRLVGQIQPTDNTATGESFEFVIDETDSGIMHAMLYNTSLLSDTEHYVFEIRLIHKTTNVVSPLLYGSVEVKPTILSPVRQTFTNSSDGFIDLG